MEEPALPPNWEAHEEDDTGRTYYHNSVTDEVSWDYHGGDHDDGLDDDDESDSGAEPMASAGGDGDTSALAGDGERKVNSPTSYGDSDSDEHGDHLELAVDDDRPEISVGPEVTLTLGDDHNGYGAGGGAGSGTEAGVTVTIDDSGAGAATDDSQMDSFAAPSPIADSTDDGEEEAVLREIFEMCDADEDGILDVDEVRTAYDHAVPDSVKDTPAHVELVKGGRGRPEPERRAEAASRGELGSRRARGGRC